MSICMLPLLIILRCWKVDTGFAISPHRHCHRQFVSALCAQVLSVPTPPFVLSHPLLRWRMHVLFSYQLSPDILVPLSLPVKESVLICVFQPLSFDVSLPPNERQSVSESLKRYLWCCQNDSSGRRVVYPFMLFICCTYSYPIQLWRLLRTRNFCH